MFSQKGRTMDVSSVGVANTAQYLPKAQSTLQGPFSATKQEEQAAQVIGQVAVQSTQQPQQPPQTPSVTDLAKSGIGQVLDISA